MPSYAPNAAIITAPSPATTGTTLTVGTTGQNAAAWAQGIGAAFPEVPFTGLIFQNQQQPIEGVNAETVEVTGQDGDTFTFVRGATPIAVTSGMRFAAKSTQRVYDVGDLVDLSDGAFAGTAPFTFRLRDPGGYSYTESGRPTAQWGGSAGAGHLAKRGQYYYVFEDVSGLRSSEQDFFIAFTEVS